MPLNTILQKIQSDAQKEIEAIKKAANYEADELERQAEKEFREIKNKLNDKLREEHDRHLKNVQNTIDSGIKNEILKKKQELINEIYKKAARKVRELPPEDYAKFISSLLKQSPRLEGGYILCAKEDKNLIAECLAKNALPYKISEKNVDIAGGFILENKETEINNTLKTLVEQLKEKTIIEIGNILFAEMSYQRIKN